MLYYTPVYGDEDPTKSIGHIWERGLTVDLISLFTGSRYGEKTTNNISAFCKDGLCMYYTILKDPTERPEQILRVRVTPGQIERETFLYQQVSDVIQENHIYDSDSREVYRRIETFNPSMELQLIVRETLSSRTLEAQFDIHNGLRSEYRTDLDLQASTPIKDLFPNLAPVALRKSIRQHLGIGHCLNKNITTTTTDESSTTIDPWIGKCSLALSEPRNISQCLNKTHPKQGEWVLIIKRRRRSKLNLHNEVFRGTAALLYSILFNAPSFNGHISLS
jgi:hypothetical protein